MGDCDEPFKLVVVPPQPPPPPQLVLCLIALCVCSSAGDLHADDTGQGPGHLPGSGVQPGQDDEDEVRRREALLAV